MAEKLSNVSNGSEKLYMQLNASELSAIIMKGSPNSNDRDAGFCSGSSEGGDDLSMDHHSRLNPSSPTDASDDSVDVKMMPMALIRNKRKSSEPSKVICEREEFTGPLKKRIRYTSTADSAVVLTPPAAHTPPSALATATTPWDSSHRLPHELMPNPAQVFVRHPGVTTLHRLPYSSEDVQQEPLALVLKKPMNNGPSATPSKSSVITTSSQASAAHGNCSAEKIPQIKIETEQKFNTNSLLVPPRPDAAASVDSWSEECFASQQNTSSSSSSARPHQRNYKNMTRERRIEANARERTRVHTISAAYETLRKAVPSYSNSQKLSKLSVLRVACSYILTLSRMAGEDYSEDQSKPSIASCIEAVTATIQTEGKIRKKKDE